MLVAAESSRYVGIDITRLPLIRGSAVSPRPLLDMIVSSNPFHPKSESVERSKVLSRKIEEGRLYTISFSFSLQAALSSPFSAVELTIKSYTSLCDPNFELFSK